ncbi:hypothetical protein PLESTM_001213900 [Pleodorina starrii]|nr:hypothetical protein PLESTM_001213900 [Pleodorina starrii]
MPPLKHTQAHTTPTRRHTHPPCTHPPPPPPRSRVVLVAFVAARMYGTSLASSILPHPQRLGMHVFSPSGTSTTSTTSTTTVANNTTATITTSSSSSGGGGDCPAKGSSPLQNPNPRQNRQSMHSSRYFNAPPTRQALHWLLSYSVLCRTLLSLATAAVAKATLGAGGCWDDAAGSLGRGDGSRAMGVPACSVMGGPSLIPSPQTR